MGESSSVYLDHHRRRSRLGGQGAHGIEPDTDTQGSWVRSPEPTGHLVAEPGLGSSPPHCFPDTGQGHIDPGPVGKCHFLTFRAASSVPPAWPISQGAWITLGAISQTPGVLLNLTIGSDRERLAGPPDLQYQSCSSVTRNLTRFPFSRIPCAHRPGKWKRPSRGNPGSRLGPPGPGPARPPPSHTPLGLCDASLDK